MDKLSKENHIWLSENARYILEDLIVDHVAVFEKLLEMEQKLKQNEWISIKDRLPEIDERVLIYKPKAGKKIITSHRCYTERNAGNGALFFNESKYYGGTATHWKPLPKPPTGE